MRQRARAFIREIIDVAGIIRSTRDHRLDAGASGGRDSITSSISSGWRKRWTNSRRERRITARHCSLSRSIGTRRILIKTVADGVKLIGSLRAKNVKLLCDLFHMNIEERRTLLSASDRSGVRMVGHVHFADSNRRAVGFGHTPMSPILSALRRIGYDGYLSAEVLPLPDSERGRAANDRQLSRVRVTLTRRASEFFFSPSGPRWRVLKFARLAVQSHLTDRVFQDSLCFVSSVWASYPCACGSCSSASWGLTRTTSTRIGSPHG